MNKFLIILDQYRNALRRLEEVLAKEKDEFMRDSAIQRFEFVFDLSWKVVKVYLEEKFGIIKTSPKECFREAYKQGLINKNDYWIEMTDLRNQTVHTYSEKMAEKVYQELPRAVILFKELSEKVKEL